jgi:hypothetical protein
MLHKQDDPEDTVPSCLKLIVTWEIMCRFITSMKNSAQVPHRHSSREHRKRAARAEHMTTALHQTLILYVGSRRVEAPSDEKR